MIRSDLGLLGQVCSVSRFRGTSVGRISVKEVIYSRMTRKPVKNAVIVVMAGTENYFVPAGDSMVLFLKNVKGQHYRSISRITFGSPAGRRRFEVLRDVLRIETSGLAPLARAQKLKALFFGLAVDAASEIRLLAVRELEHLSRHQIRTFQRQDAERLAVLDLKNTTPACATVLARLSQRLCRLPDRSRDRLEYHQRLIRAASREQDRIRNLLAAIEELRDRALPLLIARLDDDRPSVRKLSAYHLGELGDPVSSTALLRRARVEKDPEVTVSMIDALGRLGAVAAVPFLRSELRHESTRAAGIVALARIGSREARAVLDDLRGKLAAMEPKERDACRKTLDFISSEEFRKQEQALKRLQKKQRIRGGDGTR